jgi:hypothetical protein
MIGERILNPQELPPYDFLMERVLGKTRNNVDQDQVERLMALISYHETGGTMEPFTIQKSNLYDEKEEVIGSKEGPGRGLYQYELETLGGSGAGRTAMNNLLIAYGGEVDPRGAYDKLPKWAKKYFNINNPSHYPNPEGDVDFSELTEEQQKILFLADKLEDPKVKLADIGVLADHEWWAKYHHKGADPNVQKFSNDAARYLKGEFRKLHNIE